MLPGRISNATHALGAPLDWNKDDQGACSRLFVRAEGTSAGPGMTSAWFPTQEEIARIVEGAPIYLTILGSGHPPVCMGVGPRPGFEG